MINKIKKVKEFFRPSCPKCGKSGMESIKTVSFDPRKQQYYLVYRCDNCNLIKVPYDKYRKNRDFFFKGKAPILPILWTREGDKHNTKGFTFNWLILKVWSLDSVGFEISFVVSSHFGIGFTAVLPYLRIILCIPLPDSLEALEQKYLWRKPKE